VCESLIGQKSRKLSSKSSEFNFENFPLSCVLLKTLKLSSEEGSTYNSKRQHGCIVLLLFWE
jgi:hypothetical protein